MNERIIKAVYPSRFAERVMHLTSPACTTSFDLLADAFRHLDDGATARLNRNFAIAFPQLSEAERRDLIKRHWRARFQSELERIQLNGMPRRQLLEYCRTRVEIEGEENLRAACESPQPVIFFTPHYGSFVVAVMRAIMDVEQHKTLSLFYDPPEVNPTTTIYRGLIERLGGNSKILFNDKTAVLKGLRALKNGNALGIMPDVYDFNMGMMYVPFFGRLAVAMGGTAFFALKAKARLIPVYCWRRGRGRFILKYGAPVELSRTGNFNEDVYLTTASIFKRIEEQLTAAPEHWIYWESLHERFSFGGNVALPHDTTSWESQFTKLCDEVAEEQSSLGRFLGAFQARLRHRSQPGPAALRQRTGTG
jgi:KDO2-lipid IV(A) lauroyltransferase